MVSTLNPDTAAREPDRDFEQQLRDVNEALLISSVRQHELTDRAVQAEAAAARLAAIVTYSEDAIISKDLDGIITSWNRGAQQLFGYSAEEVIGKSVSLLIPLDHLDEEPRLLERVRRGEPTEHYETVRRRKDGTFLDISLTVSPLRDSTGRIIGASKIARDITVRKRSEMLLAAQKEMLELAANGGVLVDVLRLVVHAARSHLGEQSRTSLFLLEPDGLHLRFAVTAGLSEAYTQVVDLFEVGPNSPSCGTAAFTGQPVIVGDVTLDPLWAPFLSLANDHDIRAVWSVPLRTLSGKVLGTLAVYHRTPRLPEPGELDAIKLLSQTAALLIERNQESERRKQAETNIQKQNERLHLLWEAAKVLLFTSDPGAMLHGLLAKIGPQLGVDGYLNYMMDAKGSGLRLMSYHGIPEEAARSVQRLEFGQATSGVAALHRQTIVETFVQKSSIPRTEFIKLQGIRAYACNPLLSDNILLGTLAFASLSKDEFAVDELAFLQTISNYVAVAYSRRRTQDAMRDSEERLRFIMDSMPQKIFTTTVDGEIAYFNPQWTEFTGMTAAEMKNSGWTKLVHPDDVDEKIRLWHQAFETGEPFQSEHRFRRADGEYRWHFSRAVPMRNDAGQILMWVGSNTDVHEIKQSEVALKDSEVRYRRLFEASKDGILILDAASQKITHVNPFLTDLLDYPVEHFLDKELWEIGFLRDKRASRSAMQQLEVLGSIRYESLPLEDSHGNLHPVELVANVYNEGPHVVIQCNIRDISERSRLEALLRGQASELSDLHRRKDEFLAMLSHELRSPLAPIANAVQLLGLQKETETRIHLQARQIIERQLAQLQHLVDDLLDVSRITTGRVQLRRASVLVSDIVKGAGETVHSLIEQRRQELTVSVPREPIRLHADVSRLEQVLVNLLTNAAKFTDIGGHIWLTVYLEGSGDWRVASGENEEAEGEFAATTSPTDVDPSPSSLSPSPPPLATRHSPLATTPPPLATPSVVFRVRDSGVGIAPALLPRIFELFTQGERTLDRSQGGLGIGLALVQRLTELHGGTVEVHSILGQGSEFIVRIPVPNDEGLKTKDGTDDAGSLATRHSPLATPLRVLVVDDNADTALSLSMLLGSWGHDVRTASDGPAAVLAALDYQPNVVLLDIGLPGLNGYEVARRLRQEPGLHDVVLVALTGYGQETDRQSALHAGFNHHLVKPADSVKLKQILTTEAVARSKAGSG